MDPLSPQYPLLQMLQLLPLHTSATIKHQIQLTLELGETFGVRGRQTLSAGHHSKVGVSQIWGELIFQWLVHLADEFRLLSYNFSHQHLQLICKHVFSLLGLLGLVIKVCN